MPDKSNNLRTSGTFTPDIIEDIQVKAELGRYRIRGFGTLRERRWATFDDLTFIPCTLTRIPLEGYRERCSVKTVLGTRFAEKPIELEIPIMITGMSWGRALLQREGRAGKGREYWRLVQHHRRRWDADGRAGAQPSTNL